MRAFVLFLLIVTVSYAQNEAGENLAKELHLIPGSKASIQWKRIFKSPNKQKRYRLTQLSQKELEALKKYLIEHAADSPKPIVPGL